jgi:hypothetical protein
MSTVEIPQSDILNALDAMAWTFNPYLDGDCFIHDYPYIVELINSYNSIANFLPEDIRIQYPPVSFT